MPAGVQCPLIQADILKATWCVCEECQHSMFVNKQTSSLVNVQTLVGNIHAFQHNE